MTLVFIPEDEEQEKGLWQELLGLEPVGVDDLVKLRILQQVSNSARDQRFRIEFVGFIATRDRLAIVLPRFGVGHIDASNWLRRVLGVYFRKTSRENAADPLEELGFREELAFRELDALATLRLLFERRGLFTRQQVALRRDGHGIIDWERTIDRVPPVMVMGSAFFPETLSARRQAVANEVSLLQAVIFDRLARKYEESVPDVVAALAASAPDDFLSIDNVPWHLGTLRREQTLTYLADDLLLLDTMASVLEGLAGMAGMSGPILYGTRKFEMVWEDALRDLFGHDQVAMAQPVWRDWDGEGWSDDISGGEQRPDIVITRPGETLILDAKYHYPFPKRRPGWQDVVKQLYYAETTSVETGLVGNVLMMPMHYSVHTATRPPLRLAGQVRIAGGARLFPAVEAWLADPHWVFLAYGQSDSRGRPRARSQLFAARDESREILLDANGDIGSQG